jgi:hypothetical protein
MFLLPGEPALFRVSAEFLLLLDEAAHRGNESARRRSHGGIVWNSVQRERRAPQFIVIFVLRDHGRSDGALDRPIRFSRDLERATRAGANSVFPGKGFEHVVHELIGGALDTRVSIEIAIRTADIFRDAKRHIVQHFWGLLLLAGSRPARVFDV